MQQTAARKHGSMVYNCLQLMVLTSKQIARRCCFKSTSHTLGGTPGPTPPPRTVIYMFFPQHSSLPFALPPSPPPTPLHHAPTQVTHDISHLTCADFLRAPGVQTPVIVRFSTVIHERGSPETIRDPRGFAVKFYTREGNFDMVGEGGEGEWFCVHGPRWAVVEGVAGVSLGGGHALCNSKCNHSTRLLSLLLPPLSGTTQGNDSPWS